MKTLPLITISGGSRTKREHAQIARELINMTRVQNNLANNFAFCYLVPSQLILQYAYYMLNVFIHQFLHMESSDETLPILQNIEKTIFVEKT